MLALALAATLVQSDLRDVLNDPALEGAIAGICVMTLDGEVVFENLGDTRLVPASNQKILSTIYALNALGVQHRPQTRFWRTGESVYVDAPGSPTMTKEQLLKAREALGNPTDAAINVRQAYQPKVPPSWEFDDLPHRYAARVTAFSFDRGGLEIWAENREVVQLDPAYKVVVRGVGGDGAPKVTYDPWTRVATVSGRLPKARNLIEAFAMPDPAATAARFLGGTLVNTDKPPPRREPDFVVVGPPILRTVQDCLERSDNNHAENLMLMAASASEPLGDSEYREASSRMKKFLVDVVGIRQIDVKPVDASGMSRQNLVTPKAICQSLAWAHRQPWGEQYLVALAAGGEGTLGSRLKTSTFIGKTGTLNAVVCLSGYVRSGSGETLIVSMLFNHTVVPARRVRAVQDRLIDAIERGL
ncbi:MAG: D-alanyl-D-alanine carboxypeptidase/D-alanyl-D-alanine-endopeptidase [Armatimonadetes bacterium]|nr:D-alanyl-D-alanine carboxypeptidase/D-alanyl-D-alanine-endopeptidase [Armatimonadota bacterium]